MPINNELTLNTWRRYRYCVDRGHIDFLKKAEKCDNFVLGNQWLKEDLLICRAKKIPTLTINKVHSTVTTLQGEQIINRNEVLFRPASGGTSEVADALTKVWMQIAQNNQLPWVRSTVFDDGIIRSRGFYDVRLDFDDNMQGEVRITPLNSKNVVIDPDAQEYDPDYWNDVFVTKWMCYQDIALIYNEEDAEYLRDRDISTFAYGYDSLDMSRDRFGGNTLRDYADGTDEDGVRRNIRVLERQHHQLTKQKHFVDSEMGDTRPVPDGWDRNRIAALIEKSGGKLTVIDKMVQRIRWTVTADNVVLHDEWSPYTHFTVVPYFPQFRYGQTSGVVEHLIDPQEVLNKVTSQELHIVNTTANSGWKVKAGALRNMSIEELEQDGAKTGLILELDEIVNAEKILPNPTPQGLDRISYKAEEHIKTISNVSDSMQGFDREDVAAKAIAYKQQRSSVNHSKAHDNLERSDWLLARNVLDIVQTYYTEPRLVNVTVDNVTNEAEQVPVNQPDPVTGQIVNDLTLGEYHIVVTSTPARATLEDSQFEQALAMRKEGIQIPDNFLIENSRLLRRAEIVKQMSAQAESPEAQMQAQLQMQQMQLTVAKLQAEVQKITADAGKSQADAALKANEAQGGDVAEQQKMQAELEMEQARLEMDRERMAMELQMKREEMELKRQEMAMKLQLDQQKAEQDMALKQQQAQQDAALKQQQAEQEAARQEDEHNARLAAELRGQSTPNSANPDKE